MNRIDFTNKSVIITGASSGIGAETARAFAKYGANLTIVGRNKERLEKVALQCQATNGLQPLCILLDLTHENSCEMLINKTIETYKKIDVLINCAGKVKIASVFDKGMEVFDEMMAINLRVPYLLTQLVLPHLLKTGGNIVNVGSSLSSRHRQGFLPYVLSKAALQRFTEHAAAEVATEGVRINCINPGITRTNILNNFNIEDQCLPLVYNVLEENLGRIIEPKEVAIMICLTASGIFPNLSGSGLHLDGAISMF